MRESGIKAIGKVPWGTHFCQFYRTKQDLLEILVPYFTAGLHANEFCMWVTSNPLGTAVAESALRNAVPDFDAYVMKGQIEIRSYDTWYRKDGVFEASRVLEGWVQKHDAAIQNGFDGLRLAGNTFWLEPGEWKRFEEYEHAVDSVIGKYRMLALCTYSLERCGAEEIADVYKNHEFALSKVGSAWTVHHSDRTGMVFPRSATGISTLTYQLAALARANERKTWIRYIFALGVTAAAALIRVALDPVLENNIPYVTIFPAIVIAAVYAGMGPAIAASLFGTVLAEMLFIEERGIGTVFPLTSLLVRAGILLVSGTFIGWFGSSLTDARRRLGQNVEAAKKAKETLLESHERLNRAQEMAHLGSWELDLSSNSLSWSDEVYRIFGLQPREFAATYEAFLAAVHPDDRNMVDEAYADSVRNGNNGYDIEHRIVRPDGDTRIVHEKCVHIRDAAGTIIRSVGMVQDITEYQHAMDALRRSEEAKNNFISTLAHELRNPLSPILARAELLKSANGDGTKAKPHHDMLLSESVEVIERQAKNLQRLIDDLLDVSRIERGKIILRKEPTDVAQAIARALETISAICKQQGHKIIVTFPQAPLRITADPVRLEQILSNLLVNAVKYTPPGGEIYVTAEREGTDVVMRVKDNGVGISEDQKEAIFELFAHVEASQVHIGADLGIGLHVTRNLVHLHGGSITVESKRGKGSEFIVRLPALPRQNSVEPKPAVAPTSKQDKKQILIVDDNHDAGISLGKLLSMYGHDVRIAHDGKSAIAEVAQKAPQLVLLDIGLPDMDGYAVAQALRKAHGNDLKIVALTGYGQEEDKAKAVRAGFDRHLVKPVSGEVLQSVIAEL